MILFDFGLAFTSTPNHDSPMAEATSPNLQMDHKEVRRELQKLSADLELQDSCRESCLAFR